MNSNDDQDDSISPELKKLLEQKREEMFARNNSSVDDFAGLTPSQMYELINNPLDSSESPIRLHLAIPEIAGTSIFCQAMLIALNYFSSEKGEKLTPQGRWPRKLLLKLYELGDADERAYNRPPRLEEDWPIASALHVMLLHGKLLRKSKGNMITTKKGKQLVSTPATAYEWLQVEFIEHFNWAYLDGYPEVFRYQQHWGFMVWLLLQFGNEERPGNFYSDYYLKAWPMFLDELPVDRFERSLEDQFHRLFCLRYIQRGFAWLGWVDYRYEGKGFDSKIMLKATPVFYQRWSAS